MSSYGQAVQLTWLVLNLNEQYINKFEYISVLPCSLWRRWRSRWKRDTVWSRPKTVHPTYMPSWGSAGRKTPKWDQHSISLKSIYRLSWTNMSLPQSPKIIFSIQTSAFFWEDQKYFSQIIKIYCTGHKNAPTVSLFTKFCHRMYSIFHFLIYFYLSNTLFQKRISQWMGNIHKWGRRSQSKRRMKLLYMLRKLADLKRHS